MLLSLITIRKLLQYSIAAPGSLPLDFKKLRQSSSRSLGLLYFLGLSFGTGSLSELGIHNWELP